MVRNEGSGKLRNPCRLKRLMSVAIFQSDTYVFYHCLRLFYRWGCRHRMSPQTVRNNSKSSLVVTHRAQEPSTRDEDSAATMSPPPSSDLSQLVLGPFCRLPHRESQLITLPKPDQEWLPTLPLSFPSGTSSSSSSSAASPLQLLHTLLLETSPPTNSPLFLPRSPLTPFHF